MSYSIIPQLKLNSKNPDQATIIIRGYLKRKAIVAKSTGIKILFKHWDTDKKELIPAAPNARLINNKISIQLQEIQAILLKKEIMGGTINRLHIIHAVQGNTGTVDFFEFCRIKISYYQNEETKRSYLSEISKMEKFQAQVSFNDIDYGFLTRYKQYMISTLKNTDNTVWKTFKFMNAMLNDAIKNGGIISCNPFETFNRGKYIQTQRNFLILEHCDAIEKLTSCSDDTIKKVAIYFLLMAYSGMRFSDAINFDPEKHVVDDERIVMNYQKMKTDVNNKMYPRLKRIVDLIRESKLQMTNQKFNQWLKIIAVQCNIPCNLSSHVGRHTMGSMLAKMGISEENAKVILGHGSIKSTRIYYHQQISSIDAAMDKMNGL